MFSSPQQSSGNSPGSGSNPWSNFGPKALAGGMGGAGLGGLLAMLFGGGNDFQNPADSAMPYMNKIPDALKQYLSPYINQGQSVYPQLQNTYSSLMNDPTQIYNKIGAGYKQSPGFQFNLSQAMNAGNNAAAAGGALGSPASQQMNADVASGLASRDFGNFMQNNIGMMNTGLQGEQGMYDTGFHASNNLAQMLSQALMGQGSIAAGGAEAQNQYNANQQKQWADLFGQLGGAAGMFAMM